MLRDGFLSTSHPSFLQLAAFWVENGEVYMKVISFSMYYCKLQVSVLLGFYKTAYPLNVRWRWNHWQHKYYMQHDR